MKQGPALRRLHVWRQPLQVSAFRRRLEKVVGDKHEEIMARMGAIMATGADCFSWSLMPHALTASCHYTPQCIVIAVH